MESAITYLVMLGAAIFVVTLFIVTVCIMFVIAYILLQITRLIIERLEKRFKKRKQAEDMWK